MKNSSDIPSHTYREAADNVQRVVGKSHPSFDPQFPFTMARFESMNGLGLVDYPHRHDCYEILYISEGQGTHFIDFEPYPIQPDTCYFLAKGQIHFWQLSKPLKGYALLFSEEFLGFSSSKIVGSHDFSFFHHVGDTPCLAVEETARTMLNGLFTGLEQEFYNDNERSLSVLRAYLHILLTQLQRLYNIIHPEEHSLATSSLVRQFKQLVAEHFIAEQSVQDYAKRIGISSSHLRDTVKAVTGYAPGQIIRHKLVLEAKRLLVHSHITVAEIGYRLNFQDASYFGRFFKRETGISPIAFRQQVREKYPLAPQ